MPNLNEIEEQKGIDLNASLFFEDMKPEYLKKTVAQICELARAEDKKSLDQLLKKIVCIDIYYDKSAVEQLAAEGDSKAVQFLIEHFQASLNHAVRGAAFGNYPRLIERLLHLGACLDNAVTGAALGGHIETMHYLIIQGGSIHYAVKALSEMNNQSEVRLLLAKGAELASALEGAARGGHILLIDELLGFNNRSKEGCYLLSIRQPNILPFLQLEKNPYCIYLKMLKKAAPHDVLVLFGNDLLYMNQKEQLVKKIGSMEGNMKIVQELNFQEKKRLATPEEYEKITQLVRDCYLHQIALSFVDNKHEQYIKKYIPEEPLKNKIVERALIAGREDLLKKLSNREELQSKYRKEWIHAAASRGCVQTLESLEIKEAETSSVLPYAATSGHKSLVRKYLQEANLSCAILGAAEGYELSLLKELTIPFQVFFDQLIRKDEVLDDERMMQFLTQASAMNFGLRLGNHLNTEQNALRILLFLPSIMQHFLLETNKEISNFSLNSVQKKMAPMDLAIKEQKFTLNEELAWEEPAFRGLLTCSLSLSHLLPPAVYFLIATYFALEAPANVDICFNKISKLKLKVMDLSMTLCEENDRIHKKPYVLANSGAKFQLSSTVPLLLSKINFSVQNSFFNKGRKLLNQCKEAKSDQELINIIDQEIILHSKKDPEYTKILEPYLLKWN